MFELQAVEGCLVGSSNNSKNHRVYNPVSPCIMKTRGMVSIEAPSRLFPPPSEVAQKQLLLLSSIDLVTTTSPHTTTFCRVFAISLRC